MNTITDYLRYAADSSLQIPSLVGINPFQVFVVTITNAGGPRPGVSGTRVRTDQRLTVWDGYQSFAQGDGYLYPMITTIQGERIVLQTGKLNDVEWWLGPLALPYQTAIQNGGTDTSLFEPVDIGNTQIYIHCFGPGLDAINGSYFVVKEIEIGSNYLYRVKIKGYGKVVPQ